VLFFSFIVLPIKQKAFLSYVDDPRNTDNSWMETVAFHFHDETGEKVHQIFSFISENFATFSLYRLDDST